MCRTDKPVFKWRRPSDAPEHWVEFYASTMTHILKVWIDSSGQWCGVMTEKGTWARRRLCLDVKSELEAKVKVESIYFEIKRLGE